MFRSYQTIIKSHDGLLRQKLVAGRKNNTVIVLDGVLTFLLLSPELDFRFFSVLFLVGMVWQHLYRLIFLSRWERGVV